MLCAVLPSTSSFAICALLIQCISYLDVNLWVAHHSNAEGVEMRSWHEISQGSIRISFHSWPRFSLDWFIAMFNQSIRPFCWFVSCLIRFCWTWTCFDHLYPSSRMAEPKESKEERFVELFNSFIKQLRCTYSVLLWNDKHSETCSETSFWSLAYISVFVPGGLCLMWQLDCGMQWVLPRENLGQSSSMFFQWNHIAVSCLWIRIADMDPLQHW